MKKSLLQITMIIPLALLLCFTFGCQKQVEEGITEEEAKVLVERNLEIYNEGNLALVDELYDPEYVGHYYALPEDIGGLDALKKVVSFYRNAYPDDYNMMIDEMIVKGDKIVSRWTMTGTNTGPRGDVPPTGKKVRMSGIIISRITNGKIVEDWNVYNLLDVMQQLGFTLTPPQPAAPQEKE